MDEIITERSGSVLRIELNRPTKKNAMTSGMYVTSRRTSSKEAAKDERIRCRALAWRRRFVSVRATMWRTF